MKALVSSGSWTIEATFTHLATMKSLRSLPISQLAANIGAELITSENSPLPWEGRDIGGGYFGQARPVARAVFGDSALVERLSEPFGPLDLWADLRRDLTPDHYKNYRFAAQLFAADYFEKHRSGYRSGYTLRRTMEFLKNSTIDLYQLDGVEGSVWESPQVRKLEVAVEYVRSLMDLMEENGVKARAPRDERSIHNDIAEMIVELVVHSTGVKGPQSTAWLVQHNLLWGPLWSFKDGASHRAVLRCVTRKIYDEVKKLDRLPNYKGARLLGYALNIFGLSEQREHEKWAQPLKIACHAWARRNYLGLRNELPDVADAVLIGSLSFDQETDELVKTYAKGLSREAPQERLRVLH